MTSNGDIYAMSEQPFFDDRNWILSIERLDDLRTSQTINDRIYCITQPARNC